MRQEKEPTKKEKTTVQYLNETFQITKTWIADKKRRVFGDKVFIHVLLDNPTGSYHVKPGHRQTNDRFEFRGHPYQIDKQIKVCEGIIDALRILKEKTRSMELPF